MSNEARIVEIIGCMKALRKAAYYKEETLQGLLNLQDEVLNLTFAEGHAERMRLSNVVQHFEDLNSEYGNVADDVLERFKVICDKIGGKIAMEFSGQQGERTVFRILETIKTKHISLRNTELNLEANRAELDSIIITPKAIYHIEIKNPKHDTTIDAIGNYYRTDNHMYYDCNLGERISNHSHILRNVIGESHCLDDAKPLVIKSFIVSANSRAEFVNQFKYIESCYFSQLPFIIDGYDGKDIYTPEDMDAIAACIREAECKRTYPIGFDVDQFRFDFATLMATLEDVAEQKINAEEKDAIAANTESTIISSPTPGFWGAVLKYVGCALTGVAVGLFVTKGGTFSWR